MRLFPLIIVLSFGLPLWADDIPSGPGDPKSGAPSGTCGDKKNMTIINFRAKVGDDKDAINDCQLVKRSDGWHFNAFEGEDIYFNSDSQPCIKSGDENKAPVCGDGINSVNSWRDTDGVKRTHNYKVEYEKDGPALKITFLDKDGHPRTDIPYIHLDGQGVKKDQTTGHGGSISASFHNPSGKDPKMDGTISADSEQEGKTPTAPDSYITPNKINLKPQTGANSSAQSDKVKMPDSKAICEAQGISGWDVTVNASNEFDKKKRQQEGDPPDSKLTDFNNVTTDANAQP